MNARDSESARLLEQLRSFCFPGGEAAARSILAVSTVETGHLQMVQGARLIPFTAEQTIEAGRTQFCWRARLDPGKLTSVTVTDAYENSHGCVSVKLAGVIPAKTVTGPEADRGELQRYLASVALCPLMLLNHESLECEAVGPLRLRLWDQKDEQHATVEVELSEYGCPLRSKAERPRLVGRQSVLTPWIASASEFRVCEGVCVPFRLEAAWELPEGIFAHYHSQIVSYR